MNALVEYEKLLALEKWLAKDTSNTQNMGPNVTSATS
jgi:hypothetical protein